MESERYASNAKGNTGVALGATGLGVAALDLMGGLGNLFGGRCNNAVHYCFPDDEPVTRHEAEKDATIARKDSEIALLKSEQKAEEKLADVFTRVSVRIKALEDEVNKNTCGQAVTNQQIADNINFVDSKFDGVYRAIADGDERVKCYVDCHFVPGQLVMPLKSICPEAMPLCPPTKSK